MGLADDEAGALDGGENLRLRLGSLERGGRAGDGVDVADPAGVTRLDRKDRAGGGEDLLRLDVAHLAEVRRDARVLEDLRGGLELLLVGNRGLELEPRLLDGLGTESVLA
jgi:hypothetical protein